LAKGTLREKHELLELSLDGELTPRHLFVLKNIREHIRYLESELASLDAYLIDAMAPDADDWRFLQTLPGLDQISAAMILVEIAPTFRPSITSSTSLRGPLVSGQP